MRGDRDEDGGRQREVKDAITLLRLVGRLEAPEIALEVLEGWVIFITTRHVGADFLKLLNFLRVHVLIFYVRGGAFVELGFVHLCACVADYLDALGQEAIAKQPEDSRECLWRGGGLEKIMDGLGRAISNRADLLLCEIARCTKD